MHHTYNWENIKNIDNAFHFGFQKYEPSKYVYNTLRIFPNSTEYKMVQFST